MTTYLALARKWRPHAFDEIVGQKHVVTALSNALSQQKIHHAYLLTGTHGVGKTTLARIFAKSLNCEAGVSASACNQCSNCQEIDAGRFPDLYEIDAASRTKVEDTRELLDNVPYAPTKGRYKVYLIDEVHMLSGHSFNALLKTLEEPPEHVKFLLATTDPQKLPATVLSRCLQFHLLQLLPEQIDTQLAHILNAESISFEPDALSLLSQAANGSMRDALSLLDQGIAYCGGKISANDIQHMLGLSNQADIETLISAIHAQDANKALELTQTWAQSGVNFTQVLKALLSTLHKTAIAKALNDQKNPLATVISPEDIQLYYQIALIGQKDLPFAPSPRAGFDMVVIRMMTFIPENNAASNKNLSAVKQRPQNITAQSPKAAPKKSASTAASSPNDWHTLINQLNLTGPTHALAQQCTLAKLTETSITLNTKPKYKALISDRLKSRLKDALTQHFNHEMQLTIEIKDDSTETPAETAERLQAAKKESAKHAMHADPTLQRMMQQFDATLLEDSIEPIQT